MVIHYLREQYVGTYIKSGICSYVAAAKPFLNAKHIASRLNCFADRLHWTQLRWNNVAFMDESSFAQHFLKNYIRVWRKVNTRYVLKNMVPTFKSGFISLCVWGMFSSKGRSLLVWKSGTLNQNKYRQILKDYVIPFKNQLHAAPINFIYQNDGYGPYRAKSVSGFLNAQNIELAPWPAQNLDLNPIEHVWAEMKRILRNLDTYTTTADYLFLKLTETRYLKNTSRITLHL